MKYIVCSSLLFFLAYTPGMGQSVQDQLGIRYSGDSLVVGERYVWLFRNDSLVREFEKDEVKKLNWRSVPQNDWSGKSTMFWWHQLGGLLGNTTSPMNSTFSFSYLSHIGYNLNRFGGLAVTTGIENFAPVNIVPIAVTGIFRYPRQGLFPALTVSFGTGLVLLPNVVEEWEDPFVDKSAGRRLEVGMNLFNLRSDSGGVSFGISYQLQDYTYATESRWNNDRREVVVNSQRVSIRMGVYF